MIHTCIWGGEADRHTVAAILLGPGRAARFTRTNEHAAAAALFQLVADAMPGLTEAAGEDLDGLPPPLDELDALR